MNDGEALREYLSINNVDISNLATKLKKSRAVIYTHCKKPSLKDSVKEMYTKHFGVKFFLDTNKTYTQKDSNGNVTTEEDTNQIDGDNILSNPKGFNREENHPYGKGYKKEDADVSEKPSIYASIEILMEKQQSQIVDILTTNKMIKDQFDILRQTK